MDRDMLQPPENHKACPRCGSQALLILDFFGMMPELDSWGYPQYHCPTCANTFTAFDLPHSDNNTQEKEGDNGNQQH